MLAPDRASPPEGIAATPRQHDSEASIDLSAYTGPHHDRAMTLNGALPADAFVWPRDHLLRRLPVGSVNGYPNAQGLARLYHWALGTFPAATLTDLTTPHTSGPDLVFSAPDRNTPPR